MKKVVLAIVIIIVMLLFVSCNIKMYGIHYAKYTPHTGTSEPVLQMLVDNLEYVEKLDLNEFRYGLDGTKYIAYINIEDNTEKTFGQLYNKKYQYRYVYRDGKGFVYFYDKMFKISDVLDKNNNREIYVNEIDREAVISSIYTTFQPIIDVQPSPLINLQWIFDMVYHKKFNQ